MIQTEAPKTSATPRSLPSAALLSPLNILFAVVLVVVVGLHLYAFFATMVLSPVGFDEAFNLQAPLNLVNGNGYSTEDWLNGGPRIIFDPVVSTGPVVEVPAALSFVLFGQSIEAARIVMLPYLLLLLGSLFVLGRRAAGRWGGVAAVAMALTLDSRADFPSTMIYGSSDALGEYASAALIAFALVLVARHRKLAALALGFAALAKFISFIAVPAFIIAMLLVPLLRAGKRERPLREALVFGALSIVPSVGWELVKFISLGPSRYIEILIDYLRFIFRSGSGADGAYKAFFLERLARLFAAWYLPTVLVIVLSVVLAVFAVIGLLRYFAPDGIVARWRSTVLEGSEGSRLSRFRTFTSTIPVSVWAAAGTLAAFAVWWSLVSSSLFIRHTMPVLLATLPLIAAFAVRGVQHLLKTPGLKRIGAIVSAAGLVVVMGVQTSATMVNATSFPVWQRSGQEGAANYLRESGITEVQGIGWWAAPAVRFLSGVPSKPVGTGTGTGPLVLEPILKTLGPGTYQWGLDQCTDILYSKDDFVICEIPADTPTAEEAAE